MKKQDDTQIVTDVLSNNHTTIHIDNLNIHLDVSMLIILALIILTLVILCLSPELRSFVIHFLLNIVKQS